MKHRCPICQKIVKVPSKEKPEEAKFIPFCSQRCKLIDLGAWLDADYKMVSGPESEESGGPSNNTPIPPDMR